MFSGATTKSRDLQRHGTQRLDRLRGGAGWLMLRRNRVKMDQPMDGNGYRSGSSYQTMIRPSSIFHPQKTTGSRD
jgi:hypothetical protein